MTESFLLLTQHPMFLNQRQDDVPYLQTWQKYRYRGSAAQEALTLILRVNFDSRRGY